MSGGGFSQSRLDRMHEVMSGYVKRGELPGLVLLLSRKGAVHFDAIGTMSLDGREPMRRDTIFRIASLSKPVVAAAALILIEECKLRLDEPIDRLLPELANRKVLKRWTGRSTTLSRPTGQSRSATCLRFGWGSASSCASRHLSDPEVRGRAANQNGTTAAGPTASAR